MQHFGEADYEINKAIAKHNGIPYIAKNCDCWEGYKRVPGTKPCAPGSCEKCDSHSKKSAIKFADEANDRIEAIWNQAVKIAKNQNPNIDESLKEEVIFSCLGKVNFNDITPEMMAEKILQKSNRIITASQNNEWEEAKDIVIQRYPEEAGTNMGGGSEAVKIAKYHLDEIFDEANAIASNLGGPTVENFVAAIEQIYYLDSSNSKTSSQGDKPSPHAAQAVLAALEAGDEEEAKELLKKTDCPKGCETHPEGKCNHQYMSAGRTRVRYLINDSSFDNDATDQEFGKEAGTGQDIINMIMTTYGQYPNFARTIASFLMQAGKAFNQGMKGQQWGALGPHIENCFNLWREGKLDLDDIDQMLIGNNVVGDVNVNLPARADDFQTQQNIQPAQTAPTQQMSLAAKYRQ